MRPLRLGLAALVVVIALVALVASGRARRPHVSRHASIREVLAKQKAAKWQARYAECVTAGDSLKVHRVRP